MTIGILTYHDTLNFGAALQSSSLLACLASLGFKAENIDYTNKFRYPLYRFLPLLRKHLSSKYFASAGKLLIAYPLYRQRQSSFARFYAIHSSQSHVACKNTADLINLSGKYSALICGSDQIWSIINNGCDFNYLLDFAPDNTFKISYASSFGLDTIPDCYAPKYSSCLKRFNSISVRERSGAHLVKDMIGHSPSVVVDPVLLHDKEHWRKVLQDSKANTPCSYDLWYTNNSKINCYLLPGLTTLPNSKIVNLSRPDFLINPLRSQFAGGSGPYEFLHYIMNANHVFTTSYHCVLFCLLFNKQFSVFLTGIPGRDLRITDILTRYRTEVAAIPPSHKYSKLLNIPTLNFSYFNAQLIEDRRLSIDFLTANLG